MKCAKCAAENREGRKFCAKCAAPLAHLCPRCGASNGPGEDFCGECGTALGASATAASAKKSSDAEIRLADTFAPEDLEGERKTVTVLFADIKSSMELIEDLDPEEARVIVDPALKLMMQAVQHYGGYVAQSTGDGIFALFGAPVAHEDHPQRALFAALRMQDELKQYSDRIRSEGRPPIQARVGVNTGEVVVRSITTGEGRTEYAPVGHSTGIAARMQALAPIGSIAATDPVRRLCEGYFLFKSLGPTKVKGVSESVNVYEVTGLGPLRTRLQRAAARGYTKFVARQREMDTMKHAAELANAGHGQIVAVVAEPGVGKSRLFYEFKAASSMKWLVLEALPVSHAQTTAYSPLIELLHVYFRIAPDDDSRTRREKVAGKVAILDRSLEEDTLPHLFALLGVVEGDDPLAQMDAQIRRRRTQEAVKRVLLRESLNWPLMLIFEDLHSIDSETHAFLNLLAEGIGSAPVLLLVNYRPEYSHLWGNKTYYTQLRLDPLGREGTDEMLTALLGSDANLAPLKRLIAEKTEGNPLFMEEIVLGLFEEGSLGRNGGVKLTKPLASLRISSTIQGIVTSRIDRLPVDEKELLQTVAVIGTQFQLGVARTLSGKSEDELYRMLYHLQLAEFIYEQPAIRDVEYIFKHSLTHEVVYRSLLIERRRQLHERAGSAIESLFAGSLDDHAAELAHHFAQAAEPRWSDKAIDYSIRAGEGAHAVFAYEEAVAHFKTALELMSRWGAPTARRAELMARLGEEASVTDHALGVEYLEEALRLYESLGNVEAAAEMHSQLGSALSLVSREWNIPLALEHFRKAEAVLRGGPESASLGRLYVGIAAVSEQVVDVGRGLAASARAMEIARNIGNELIWVRAAVQHATYLLRSGRLSESYALFDEAWPKADRLNEGAIAAWLGGYARLALRDPLGAQLWYRRELAKPRMGQAPFLRLIVEGSLAIACAFTGEGREAADLAGHTPSPLVQGWVLFYAGDWESAESILTQGHNDSLHTDSRDEVFNYRMILAWVLWARQRYEHAAAMLEEAVRICPDGRHQLWDMIARPDLALFCVRVGKLARAAEHLAQCRRIISAGEDWRGSCGALARAEAVLAAAEERKNEAQANLGEALAIFRRYHLPYDEVVTLIECGRSLDAVGDHDGAVEQFDAALQICRHFGINNQWAELVSRARGHGDEAQRTR